MTKLVRMAAILLAGSAIATVTAAPAGAAPAARSPVSNSADAQLRALYNGYTAWSEKEGGYFEDANGDTEQAGYLAHVDAASQERRAAHEADLLAQLNRIPQSQLSPDEVVNAEVFRTILQNDISDAHFRTWEMPFNSDSSFWTYLDENSSLKDAAAYQRYIERMGDIPRYFDEQITNMRAGIARGFTVPKESLTGRDQTIAAFITPDVQKSPFYKAFLHMPETIPAAQQQALRQQAAAVIQQSVDPAYIKLLQFYRTEYYPKARTTLSALALPDGDAFYRAQVREYTTLDTPPEQIHQIGLKEVARIQAEMLQTMKDSGFKGTFPEFLHFLRTDPQFTAKTPDELLGVASYVAKRVDGKIDTIIGTMPRRRFGIIPVPPALAPFYTSGRGGMENCMMNTYDLPDRPLYNIPVLTLHECEPGHSTQLAIAAEQKNLPAFRRHTYFSGSGEGWGLYSEWLGNELGIYRTPYEKFGYLSYDMWRAARLVIDTGIHLDGWSRQQAIDHLASHTALSQHEVETEVDRYISWPGQALAYKLGEMTILDLRSEAEKTLGPKFSEPKFHDAILQMGSVPLSVMQDRMRAWIRAQAAATAEKAAS